MERCGRRSACGGLIWGLDAAGLRACIAEQGAGGTRRALAGAGVMLQAVWFDAGEQEPGRLLLTHPSSGGGRGVLADPGAGSCGGLGGDCGGRTACACAASELRFGGWAQRLVAQAQDRGRVGELAFWTGDAERAGSCSWWPEHWILFATPSGTARHLTLTLPAAVTGALLTRVAGGVSWRHQ